MQQQPLPCITFPSLSVQVSVQLLLFSRLSNASHDSKLGFLLFFLGEVIQVICRGNVGEPIKKPGMISEREIRYGDMHGGLKVVGKMFLI